MKSLTSVRKKHPNYPIEFKIKLVELSLPSIFIFPPDVTPKWRINFLINCWVNYGAGNNLVIRLVRLSLVPRDKTLSSSLFLSLQQAT